MKIRLVLILITSIIVSCNSQNSPSPLVSNSAFSFVTDTVVVKNNSHSDSILLGNIRALSVSNNGNLYILDDQSNHIIKIDEEGNYNKSYLKGYGRGPGETLSPNALYVDNVENIYLTDRDSKKLITINSKGDIISEKVLKMMPSKIVAFDPSSIYVIGFRFTYKDSNIIKNFTLDNKEYHLNKSFGQPTPVQNEMLLNLSGYSDYITLADSAIILSQFYPYHIQVFNKEMELVKEIKREIEGFKPPYREDGLVRLDAVMREILTLKNFFIVRYIIKDDEYFDVYSKKWDLIGSFTNKDLGADEQGKYFISNDKYDNFYVLYENPYTLLIKYEISNENSKN